MSIDLGPYRLTQLLGHRFNGVNAVAFSPDGTWVAAGASDGLILIWNPQSGDLLGILEGHGGGVSSLAISPDDGTVRLCQGQLEAAQEAFWEYLAISRRLAEQDPSNAGWQRDLAVTCWRIARLREEAGRAEAALALYDEASRIYGELAAHAPGYARWVSDKEAVESDLVRCRRLIQEAASGGEPPQGST